jgi:hypothetical protein
MRLRLSPSAVGVPMLGALGLVTIPRVYPALYAPDQAKLLALFLFVLFAAALWTPRRVRSVAALDDWGETVLRRSLRATWLVWALLALVHAELWSIELDLSAAVLVPVVGLLATRFVQRELGVWLLTAGTLVFVGLWIPGMFAVTAAMAAMALCLRALRGPRWIEAAPRAEPGSAPYRTPSDPSPPPPAAPSVVFALASAGAQLRLATGAITAVYLACWTATWSEGAWPLHVFALDLAFFAACALLFVRFRARSAALPLATSALHAGVQTGLITAPVTELGWGLAAVSLGFVLLAASLATAVRLRRSTLAPSPPS